MSSIYARDPKKLAEYIEDLYQNTMHENKAYPSLCLSKEEWDLIIQALKFHKTTRDQVQENTTESNFKPVKDFVPAPPSHKIASVLLSTGKFALYVYNTALCMEGDPCRTSKFAELRWTREMLQKVADEINKTFDLDLKNMTAIINHDNEKKNAEAVKRINDYQDKLEKILNCRDLIVNTVRRQDELVRELTQMSTEWNRKS